MQYICCFFFRFYVVVVVVVFVFVFVFVFSRAKLCLHFSIIVDSSVSLMSVCSLLTATRAGWAEGVFRRIRQDLQQASAS